MIDFKITGPKGYFVAEQGNSKGNITKISKLLSKLEKANIVLSSRAINILMTMNEETFDEISSSLKLAFKPVEGQFLRPTFASGADVGEEYFTMEDYIVQINHYFITYGLGMIDEGIFEVPSGRKVEIDNLRKRKVTKELNATFRIIDVKNTKEFVAEVTKVINMPIVFGVQQEEFIREAFNKDLLMEALATVNSIKIKENIFAILAITGKEFFKESGILKTATDILRYAYFVSEQDYKGLPSGVRFSLKTSDKRVIMSALDRIAKKDIKNVYGDIKPNKSLWLAMSRNLFPGSVKFSKFPNAQGMFNILRNGGTIETFNSVTQKLILEGNMLNLTRHLANKPGELLRSLDMIIRNSNKIQIDSIVDIIKDIKLNPKLVIQVKKWLVYRTENALEERVFNIKGKPVVVDNKPLGELKTKRTMKIVKALNEVIITHLKGKELFPKIEITEVA